MKPFSRLSQYLVKNISSNRFKYSLIVFAVAAVHFSFLILFSFLKVVPLIIFNIISVIVYICGANSIKYGYEKNIINVFYITCVEIVLHAILATVCVGWSFGFQQYLIGLVPFCFYICTTMMTSKRRYLIAISTSVFAYIFFIGSRLITLKIGCIYTLNISPTAEFMIYSYNATCNFAFLLLVTAIFILDMQTITGKLRLQNTMLDNMASVDPLTGLYNRRSMHTFLENTTNMDEKFALVMCDIDNFKRVNDTYGHDFGDVVLKDIAQIMQDVMSGNGYVCRWGGEEILILSIGNLDHAIQLAENIRRSIENHEFVLNDTTIHVTITLGIASHKNGESMEATISHADSRLYYGKQNGKNRVVSPYDMA